MLEPVKIPQNVYVEDRIVGPITLRHILICGIGAGISYAVYSMAAKSGPVGIPMTVMLWSPALVAAAFAFVKVNDLSLFNIILLLIEHNNKPSTRTWGAHPGISVNFVTNKAMETVEAGKKLAENAAKLAELTRQLEKREQALATLAEQGNRRGVTADEPVTIQSTTPNAIAEPLASSPRIQAATSLPVNPKRIEAQGLDPARSIDGVSGGLQAFDHLFKEP